MMRSLNKRLCLACLLAISPGMVLAAVQISVVGLFNGKAVLVVDNGRPQTISVGDSTVEGVKLLDANSQKALIEVDGRRQELTMGQAVSVGSREPVAPSVTIYANSAGHHITDGSINGIPFRFIVDTGATSIAMNSADARRAGIDYLKGEKVTVHTANGIVTAYKAGINTLKIGNVVLHQVEGVVLEGSSPAIVLLGMSALNRMEMKREGVALTLTKKF